MWVGHIAGLKDNVYRRRRNLTIGHKVSHITLIYYTHILIVGSPGVYLMYKEQRAKSKEGI